METMGSGILLGEHRHEAMPYAEMLHCSHRKYKHPWNAVSTNQISGPEITVLICHRTSWGFFFPYPTPPPPPHVSEIPQRVKHWKVTLETPSINMK